MSFQELLKEINKRQFRPLYLLHGEEPYFIDRIADKLEKTVLTDAEKSFNQTVLYGKDTDPLTIVNAAKRYPMMSDHQLILVKEAQDLKWGKDSEDKKTVDPLLAYLENPLSSTILVFCYKYGKFDKRKKSYKAIEKKGIIFQSDEIRDYKVAEWIEQFVTARDVKINPRAAALLAEYLGNDLSKISNEIEKLLLNLSTQKEINVDLVQQNIGISKEFNVFELQTAIAKKDPYKTNQIINYFAANPKANPIVLVLGNLNTYFTRLLRYHYAKDRSPQGLSREIGINSFFLKDYELAARNYPAVKTQRIISYLREYDLKSKGVDSTGNTEHGDLLKELMFKIIH